MSIAPGSRLGPYEIVALLGAGGMGEVYRARDAKLKREVAVKVLPPDVASDHQRLARFQREAEMLATLNHPHIAQIYGIEETTGTTALVMELVEGEDLAQVIARGAIPLGEARPMAKQPARRQRFLERFDFPISVWSSGSPLPCPGGNHRQEDVRWMVGVVDDGLLGDAHLSRGSESRPGVGVAIELREMAARDLDADTVPSEERHRRPHHVDLESIDLAPRERRRRGDALPIARAHDAFGHVVAGPVGMHVHELGHEVGVGCVRRRVQHDFDRPGDFDLLRQWLRGVDEDVLAPLDRALVARTCRRRRAAAVVAAK